MTPTMSAADQTTLQLMRQLLGLQAEPILGAAVMLLLVVGVYPS